ncbi:MAG: hypothetical protein GZ091_02755 [Paludibacter sp.]|nr:hypothetical protein [Paludibacter sp.]
MKSAKRRFTMEIEDVVTAMAINYCGGNIAKYRVSPKTYPHITVLSQQKQSN